MPKKGLYEETVAVLRSVVKDPSCSDRDRRVASLILGEYEKSGVLSSIDSSNAAGLRRVVEATTRPPGLKC